MLQCLFEIAIKYLRNTFAITLHIKYKIHFYVVLTFF